jgi:predicted phosphodiesterase
MATAKLKSQIVKQISQVDRLAADAENARLRAEVASYRGRYKTALAQIEAERKRADSIIGLAGIKAKKMRPRPRRHGKHTATMIVMLSDWHVEELVDPATVNGLNAFDLDVADRRISELTERFATLLEHERRLADISRVVVWCGGDFISGHIHDDTAELAQLAPLSATRWAGQRIAGFIDVAASLSDCVVVATNSGNHGRSTEKLRIGTELEHSFEQHMYLTMAGNETRENVQWQVATSMLGYLDLDGFTVRTTHGHQYKYGGGIGGIHIPVAKKNAAWDAVKRADLTIFGHWHQFSWLNAARYVSNGSLIGHSAYATRIGAAFEPPRQACLIIDHHRNEVTKALPIFCDRDLQKGARCSTKKPTSKKRNTVREDSAAHTLAHPAH